MQNRTPAPPAERAPVPRFAPVPRRHRSDGWTPERQRAFIDALAELGSVSRAARRINMAAEGAYALRRAPGAEGFRAAWEAALDHGVRRLADIAIERAMEGVAVPVFWRGQQVGEKRWYNDRLLMFVLRHHLPERYGAPRPLGDRARAVREAEAEGAERAAAERAQTEEAVAKFDARVDAIRRGFKARIAADPAKRAAWELLVGPTDWGDLDALPNFGDAPPYNMHRPDLILPFAKDPEAE